jgi:tripartite motif-containing protein 71
VDKSDIGPLLARSAQARDTSEATRKNSRDESNTTSYGKTRYGSGAETTSSNYRPSYGAKEDAPATSTGSKYLNRSRGSVDEDNSTSSRYGSGSGYTSRFLNKSKSSAAMSPDEEADSGGRKYSTGEDSSKYPSGRSRYAALKDRRARLARSRSSHSFGGPDDDEAEDGPSSSPTAAMSASYLASRYGTGSQSSNDLARSRSTHALKSRDNSPERPGASTEKDGAALSSWARYLKNKYGNKAGNKEGGSSSPSASATAARRLSLGLPLRHNSTSVESSDDDQKNPGGSPTSPTAATAAAAGNSMLRCFLFHLKILSSYVTH